MSLSDGRHLYSLRNIGCTLVEHLVQIQGCGCSTLRLRNSFFVYLFKSHSNDNNNTWYRYKELAALLLGLEMVFQFSHFIQSFFLTEETASERFLFEIRMPFGTQTSVQHSSVDLPSKYSIFSELLNYHCQCITNDCAIQEEKEAHGHSQNEFYHVGATCQVRILYLNRKRNFSLLSCDLSNLYYKRSL